MKYPCTHKGCDKVFDKPFGLTMHMVHGHGIKKDGSATKKPKARKKIQAIGMIPQQLKPKKPRLSMSGVKGIIADVPHALKFCPCCGLNVELAAKALDIAQEMGA
tara:strand:+ start:717 stop:1031 length:315 start_codon:yes stop_codon:yes gene_type:complete